MTRYQLRAIKRCAQSEARYFAGMWKHRSADTYQELLDQACSEFGIDRHSPHYPRLIRMIEDYADMILERAA
jgi:hypothetical protein